MSSSCIDDRLLEKYGNQSICRVVEVIHTNDLNKFFGKSKNTRHRMEQSVVPFHMFYKLRLDLSFMHRILEKPMCASEFYFLNK